MTGIVLRMEADSMQRVVLRWTPQGKRSRGSPKLTWRRTMERELKEDGRQKIGSSGVPIRKPHVSLGTLGPKEEES